MQITPKNSCYGLQRTIYCDQVQMRGFTYFFFTKTDNVTVTLSPSTILLPPTLKSRRSISKFPSNSQPSSLADTVKGKEIFFVVAFIVSCPDTE